MNDPCEKLLAGTLPAPIDVAYSASTDYVPLSWVCLPGTPGGRIAKSMTMVGVKSYVYSPLVPAVFIMLPPASVPVAVPVTPDGLRRDCGEVGG